MSDEFKPKKYYSLNLTEGRVLVIFISVILLITVLTFCITFAFFNKNKANDMHLKNLQSDSNLMELNPNENVSDIALNDEKTNDEALSENDAAAGDNISPENNGEKEIAVKEDKEIDLKSEYNKLIEKNRPDTQIVHVDDTEVLYSSKYASKKEKIDVKSKSLKAVENKSKPVKKYEQNYIVQIGSFVKKSTAENVLEFYKKQGYSSFIVTKVMNGTTYYRLRIGPYKNKTDAEKYLDEIKKSKYGENSYISVIFI